MKCPQCKKNMRLKPGGTCGCGFRHHVDGSHTPGPWVFVRYESEKREGNWNGFHVKEPDSGCTDVAYVDDVDFGPEIAEANARLIAAAPDLLDALEGFMLLDWSKPQTATGSNLLMAAKARDAIAKAKGCA